MDNKFGIPEEELKKIQARDKTCVYCPKKMTYPYSISKHNDCATIEHLNHDGPFYWKDGLKAEDIAICCGGCNSSRGKMKLLDWFKTSYCLKRNINENMVTEPVKEYIRNLKSRKFATTR